MTVQPYMFCGVAKFEPIDFWSFRHVKNVPNCEIYKFQISAKGSLGVKVDSNLVTEEMIPFENIGSLSMCLKFRKIKVSLRVFTSGSVKISGGIDRNSTDESLNIFINDLFENFKNDLGSIISFKICNLNLSAKLNLVEEVSDLLPQIKEDKEFFKIILPDWNTTKTSGRKDVYKFYKKINEKYHLRINDKGIGQILGAKSIFEAQDLCNYFAKFCK